MKHIFIKCRLLCLLAFMSISAFAQPISKEEAQLKAQQFFGKANQSRDGRGNAPRTAPLLTLVNNCDEFYIFNDESNGGYVIVSGDERMPDILGYSYDGHFDTENVPCNMEALLKGYVDEVRYVQTHEVQKKRQHAAQKWEIDYIAPLLSTTWDQVTPYNNQCPTINGKHCLTGCVATAMAQVLAYHQWPLRTTDTIPQYTTNAEKLIVPAIEPTPIDWENMLPSYRYGSYTEKQADAVANLMKLCSASIHMDYGLDKSPGSMSYAKFALVKYFGYSDDIAIFYKRQFSSNDWYHFIYDELANRRPVIYGAEPSDGGPGHAMVIDGFQGEGDNHFFHVNFGWGGSSDGFFLLPEMQYKIDSYAIVGISPLKPDSPRAYGVLEEKQLTLYYDNKHELRSGTDISSLNYKEITKCVIDSSFKEYTPYSLISFFNNCGNLREIVGLEYMNTSYVRDMSYMFLGCSSLTSLDLSSFKTDNVTSMHSMFYLCSSLTSLDVSNFNTDKVTDMWYMFSECSKLTSLDLSSFNTGNVSGMANMFNGCSSLASLDLSSFKTDNVTHMGGMFYGCSSLTSLDLSSFNTDKVMNMWGMFYKCSSLKSLDLTNFKTDNVTNMNRMFYLCSSLTSLDLSSFKTDNVTMMTWMFLGCYKLSSIYVSEKWNTNNVGNADDMFGSCTRLIGGAGTQFSRDHTGIDYAHIDGGPENPGYLTYKENTNAINTLISKSSHTQIYDLYGNRHNSLFKGINIVDGKKVMVK